MQIALTDNFVESLSIKRKNTSKGKDKKIFNMNFTAKKAEGSERNFYITFTVELTDSENFNLKMVYVSEFTTDEEITDRFMESDFPKINAPAIAYPYLRSFISLVTLNAGYGPAILPAVNFVKFAQPSDNLSK